MEALQQPANEAMIESLLDDLSTTEDSAEAAEKARLLRQLVSGIPVTIEDVQRAARRIQGTDEHERLKADIATVVRSGRVGFVWHLCSGLLTIAAAAWMGVDHASNLAPKILLGISIALNVFNVASFVSDYRLARFARDVERINGTAFKWQD